MKPSKANEKVLLLVSGGVDSSYTAKFLQDSGFDVSGLHLKLHKNQQDEENLRSLERLKENLRIDIKILDLSEYFKQVVYDYFVESYKNGLTPNPCAVCNPNIKFGKAYEYAMENGFDKMATGHYVRCDGEFIYTALDDSKDQSYFLFGLKKEILKNTIFPMGERLKSDIVTEAKAMDVLKEMAEKKESQEICFVDDTYLEILKEHMNVDIDGDVYDTKGKKVGSHKGYMHYTIGKRKGFTVNGAHEPHYVLSIDKVKNAIIVGSKDELARNYVKTENSNMFIDETEFECEVKIRYRSDKKRAKIKITDGKIEAFLEEPVYGVANGQALVMYQGDKLLGGGYIEKSELRD